MTLNEVEALLGKPGTEIEKRSVPAVGNKPCMEGDRFIRWQGREYGEQIIIGLKDGTVSDKYYSRYSL